MDNKKIIDAYCKIRTIDQTIPDDVLDFMKEAAIEKLNRVNSTPSFDTSSELNLIIDDYKRRLENISELIKSQTHNGSVYDIQKRERLITKQSEYRTFIADLSKLAPAKNNTQSKIDEYTEMLNNMKENQSKEIDHLNDEQIRSYEESIRLTAGFIRTLKELL